MQGVGDLLSTVVGPAIAGGLSTRRAESFILRVETPQCVDGARCGMEVVWSFCACDFGRSLLIGSPENSRWSVGG